MRFKAFQRCKLVQVGAHLLQIDLGVLGEFTEVT
jgi:hypothetical protein